MQDQSGFTKAQVEAIAADVRKAVQEVAAKHNLTVSFKGGRYTADDFRLGEVRFGNKATLGDANPMLAAELRKHGWRYGFTMAHINKEVQYGKDTLKFLGMQGKGWVIVEKKANKQMYKFKPDVIAQLLGVKCELGDFGHDRERA